MDQAAIKEHLSELKRILGIIDERYRLVQTFDKYSYIKRLHEQAHKQIEHIEQVLKGYK